MNKILSVEIVGIDPSTKGIAKKIKTTCGDFYSRVCAYNQYIASMEKLVYTSIGQVFDGPPLFVYHSKFGLKDNKLFPNLKNITASRKNSTKNTLYLLEIERIRKVQQEHSCKVFMTHFIFFEDELKLLELEDIETLFLLQVNAGVSYITLPLLPHLSTEKNKFLFAKCDELKKEGQEIVPLLSTLMTQEVFIELVNFFLTKNSCNLCLVSCRGIWNVSSLSLFSYLEHNFPKNKLLVGVDVTDTSHSPTKRLSHHLLLRSFGFDITCREFKIPQTEFEPTPVENKRLYHDGTGAMLNEEEQLQWEDRSFTSLLLEEFPAESNLDFGKYTVCFNFKRLNKTGSEEISCIMGKEHEEYLTDRKHLRAFWESQKRFSFDLGDL